MGDKIIQKEFIANKNDLSNALEFVDNSLEENEVLMKAKMQLNIVSDEIISNIVNYAYPSYEGKFIIELIISSNQVIINYKDNGIKFNPLEKEDPDISLNVDERSVGGLGIFMIKKMMDEVKYEYVDNSNILSVTKKW